MGRIFEKGLARISVAEKLHPDPRHNNSHTWTGHDMSKLPFQQARENC